MVVAPRRTLALVTRSVDVFESSRVLTLFTRELGKIGVLAKGARRLKSPFQSSLDLLSLCDIVLLQKRSESLDLLTEAVLVERFEDLRSVPAAFYAGCYIAELLEVLSGNEDPHPKLFDAARVTLRNLGDAEIRPIRVLRFELACLRELGLMPTLQSCVHCGTEVIPRNDRVSFGLATGGVLCQRCLPGQPHVTVLSSKALSAIRDLGSPGPSWRSLASDQETRWEVRQAVGAMIGHLNGREPRLLRTVEADCRIGPK